MIQPIFPVLSLGINKFMKKFTILSLLILNSESYSMEENSIYRGENTVREVCQEFSQIIYIREDKSIASGSRIKREYLDPIPSEEEYKYLVKKTMGNEFVNYRFVSKEDFPMNYIQYSDAFCDVTPESRIDIDCTKAKQIQLNLMREQRQQKFIELGFPTHLHPEFEASILSKETIEKLQKLRDITEPLKALDTTGKFNDEELLNQIKRLGSF